MSTPNLFSLNQDGQYVPVKQGLNGKAKSTMSHVLAIAVVSCFVMLGIVTTVSMLAGDTAMTRIIWDNVNMVIVMTVSAFLALAKDIFHPRREISIDDLKGLAASMAELKSQDTAAQGAGNNQPPRRAGLLGGG